MDFRRSQELWKRMNELNQEHDRLQQEVQTLEDAIAEDSLGLSLLEAEQRADFLELRALYDRRLADNQRHLALLLEQLTENRQNFRRVQDQLAGIQGRLQAAE